MGAVTLSLPTDQLGTMSSKSYVKVPVRPVGADREIAVYIERHAAGGLTRQVIDGGHIQSKHVHNLYTGGKPRGAGVGLVTA